MDIATFASAAKHEMSEKPSNTDRQLVESLKKGDLFAFDQLFSRYSKKLYYFARSYLDSKEDAEGLGCKYRVKIAQAHRLKTAQLRDVKVPLPLTYSNSFLPGKEG